MTAQLKPTPALPTSRGARAQAWFARLEQLPHGLKLTLKIAAAVVGMLLLVAVVTAPLDLEHQFAFAMLCFALLLLLRKIPGRLTVLAMIALSLIATLRYVYWRLTDTLGFDNWLDMFFGYGLVAAETYALVILAFGYMQTAWPLKRKPKILSLPPEQWPVVDVFVPTYNEELSIVKLTVLAAQAMDWPRDKLRVHILDDGRRDEFREFARQIGVSYIVRDNNRHAKAGNLNEALKITDGEFVAIFDADHVPTRSFLQVTMGWLVADPKLSLLQTPHFFFSADPFEKNLDTFRSVPNEGELFYGLVQDGNDLWNATFFCGSCAVIRRTHLLEVGGVAVETVTEDAHTALKLNRRGYNTAYLAIPQAAGLATESLSRHINQRIRWARGMAQIFRTDNPFTGKGLSFGQRVCYVNAMLHFFYGLPRLVFLTAPLAFLIFDAKIFHASALMITAYVLPHIFHASLTNSRIQGRFRHSFWNEVYESVLAWYIMRPVLVALINPKIGGFNVTDKGGIIEKDYFDWKLARPYIVLLVLNLIGIVCGVVQLFIGDPDATVTLIINLGWTLYNVIMTSAAVAVASESRQVRTEPRVHAELPVRLSLPDGRVIECSTVDFSQSGMGLKLPADLALSKDLEVQVTLYRGGQTCELPARVMFSRKGMAGLRFRELTLRQQSDMVRLTFSRADTWASTWGGAKTDTPLHALRDVSLVGLRGIYDLSRATLAALRHRRYFRKNPSSPSEPVMETQ
ncbi:UDP-forming cellulose synthase catalytic subunit [Pseudomonas sp. zfem002]|uniref:UDP-forming cellulose synthase catalytic subunit n=1 Tax=Pseudomonas sp. zfem002 TaxID=3078197 RepID=UPI00292786EB|nr:UDP-forming cellulose synthase catalytic subunit [Pseudomonas sp. zfem002]MDU9394835.1 UDP-forming cellulose synthase catalytic subunit [Pseudomonas sp. zfem002]